MFLFGSLGCSLLPDSSDSNWPASQTQGQTQQNLPSTIGTQSGKSENSNLLAKPADHHCTPASCSICSPSSPEPYPPLWGSARAFYYRSEATNESSATRNNAERGGSQLIKRNHTSGQNAPPSKMTGSADLGSDIPRLRLEVAPGRSRRSLTCRRQSRQSVRVRTGSTSRCRSRTASSASTYLTHLTDESVVSLNPRVEFGVMTYGSARRRGAADAALATYRSATSAPSRQNSLSSVDSSVSDRSPASVRSEHSAPCTTGKRFNLPLLRLPSDLGISGGGYGCLGPPRGHHRSFLSVSQSGRGPEGLPCPTEFRLAEGLIQLQKFFSETFPKVLERHRCIVTSTPRQENPTYVDCNDPLNSPAAALLDFLREHTNVTMIATDFDLTMTTKHSGGVVDMRTDPKGILDRLSPEFNNFAALANEKNFSIACVTFSDEKTVDGQSHRLAGAPLVEAVMQKGGAKFVLEKIYGYFPMLYQQKESYKSLGLNGPMPYHKSYHLSRLCADFSLLPDEVLLIDDDVQNCRQAITDGYLALTLKGRRGFEFRDLCTAI